MLLKAPGRSRNVRCFLLGDFCRLFENDGDFVAVYVGFL